MQYSPTGIFMSVGGYWYDSSTSKFYLNDSGDIGSLLRETETQYDNISVASISLTGALRTAEQSSGDLAKAWFSYADPIYLEISGRVEDQGGTLLFNGLLLKAKLVDDWSAQSGDPDGDSFCVWELDVATADQLRAHMFFEMVDGELSKDIAGGGQTDLVMKNFEMTILLQSFNVGQLDLDNFNSNIEYSWQPQQIKLTPIPEPFSVALLGLGLLFLRKKRAA